QDQELASREDGKALTLVEFNQSLEIHAILIAFLDAREVWHLLTKLGHGFRMNVVLGQHGVVVKKERQIRRRSHLRKKGPEILLCGKKIVGRQNSQVGYSFLRNLLRLADGSAGTCFAYATHDWNSTVHLGNHNRDRPNLILVA